MFYKLTLTSWQRMNYKLTMDWSLVNLTLSCTARHNNLVNCCLLKLLKTSVSLKMMLVIIEIVSVTGTFVNKDSTSIRAIIQCLNSLV